MKSVREISLEEIEEIARKEFSADRLLALVAAARGKGLRSRIVDPGPDPSDDEAIDHLCKMLSRAKEVRDRHPDKNRLAAIFALDAVLFFIMRVRERRAPQLMSCLCELHQALIDLERGAVPPLFELKPRRSRRPDSSDREFIKGAAAAVMSLLMKVGQTREEAARRVTNVFRRSGVKLGGRRQLQWGTVASWRNQAKRAPPESSEVSFSYRLLIDGGMLMGTTAVPVYAEREQRERLVRDLLLALEEIAGANARN
jgi:hypothetical protein